MLPPELSPFVTLRANPGPGLIVKGGHDTIR
jgi:hypothetical protein